jgi:uncharacterized protein YbjT (DUF2867 family)
VLVFGATGQQSGSVATALKNEGWRVGALVREPQGQKAQALAAVGIETVPGDFSDTASIRAAMESVQGVFSVQPSSGQDALYGIRDEEEIRYGQTIADLAVEAGVQHLVYSSINAAGPQKTGVGHFDSKSQIEAYVRGLPIAHTIIRPNAFIELLLMPDFGLAEGKLTFFIRPEQRMQFIAVEDIGQLTAWPPCSAMPRGGPSPISGFRTACLRPIPSSPGSSG